MNVPFYDHAKLYRQHRGEIDAALSRVLESGRFDWGEEVPAFEAEFAEWVGGRHAVAVGSGTAALKAALRALEIGPGHEVITVANTDNAGPSAISLVGATIVWVDIDRETRCIDTAACASAITSQTRAILPVDMYGHPAALKELRRLADKHDLALIEDACLALGAEIDSQRVGNLADATCFSFSAGKHLGAYGAAGACTTQDAALADRIRQISADGQARERHYKPTCNLNLHHEFEGMNERMDEIQAAVLRAKLPHLEQTLSARRAQADRYAQQLDGLVDLPREKQGYRHAWRNYVIEVDQRDDLAAYLAECKIGCKALYTPPMHLQPAYAHIAYPAASLPETERSCSRLLGLPLGPHLTLQQIDETAAAVRHWAG